MQEGGQTSGIFKHALGALGQDPEPAWPGGGGGVGGANGALRGGGGRWRRSGTAGEQAQCKPGAGKEKRAQVPARKGDE